MNTYNQNYPGDKDLRVLLKNAGLSITSARLNLCRYILFEAKHPCVEDIKNWVNNNQLKVSLATIYNTLNKLRQIKLLKDLRFPHIDTVYYENNLEYHHHFLDEDTGEIIDIEAKDFQIKSKLCNKYEVEGVDILIRGRIKN